MVAKLTGIANSIPMSPILRKFNSQKMNASSISPSCMNVAMINLHLPQLSQVA
jgi:hypothetical protein